VHPSRGVPVPDRGDRDQGHRLARPPSGGTSKGSGPGPRGTPGPPFLLTGDAKRPATRQRQRGRSSVGGDYRLCGFMSSG
jgi:hypothetical protein